MSEIKTQNPDRKLRMLIAIACYGDKNIELLKRIIAKYHAMDLEADVVVLSNNEKDLGPRVKVQVGLPAKNPWSLPFGHKKLFADKVNDYDLFSYSEDDMEVTEENIKAFLRVTPQLAPDEIAGYLRYEVDEHGVWSLPEIHGGFHWKPESVKQRGPNVVAEFTNEHAAFFLLTQAQLKKCIESGGFMKEPYAGRYDMLCSAATDPYTSCGFRKVICVSEPENFLIHHLSNRYTGQFGITLDVFKEQVKVLMEISRREHPAKKLCETESKLGNGVWAKDYYERPNDELLNLVPAGAKTVLSIGCGSGAVEKRLRERGTKVTALPLDSVIGGVCARAGVEVVHGELAEALRSVAGRKFDCVMVSNLLHLLPAPEELAEKCGQLINPGGAFVAAGPNFGRLAITYKRMKGIGYFPKLRSYDESGISTCSPKTLAAGLQKVGLRLETVKWPMNGAAKGRFGAIRKHLGGLEAKEWVFRAVR